MGVDPKRPLVGFAAAAVLCAVLMALSVGRGWGVDLVHPGKPIVASAADTQRDRVPPTPSSPPSTAVESIEVGIPAELSTLPLGVAAGSLVTKKAAASPVAATDDESDADSTGRATARSSKGDRTAGKAADKAGRKAEQAAEQSAEKAGRKAEKAAEKAGRKAEKAAEKAGRQAEKAAEKAARESGRLAAKLAREAAKAARRG